MANSDYGYFSHEDDTGYAQYAAAFGPQQLAARPAAVAAAWRNGGGGGGTGGCGCLIAIAVVIVLWCLLPLGS